MFMIIKYEFVRKYKLILITIISAVLLNILAAFKLGVHGSLMFLGSFPVVMAVMYITDIIKIYSDELNKTSGYMLFMTPNSGYKIILSKVAAAILEGLTILIFYILLIIVNGIYISSASGFDIIINPADVFRIVNEILSGSFGFNLSHLLVFLLAALALIINFILTAYTAITIRKSIFSEVKLGGFLSFIIFIALNWAVSYSSSKILSLMSPYYDTIQIQSGISATELTTVLIPIIILSIIQSILMTVSSGYLLEKKINL